MIRRPPRSTLFPTRRSSDLDFGKFWLKSHGRRALERTFVGIAYINRVRDNPGLAANGCGQRIQIDFDAIDAYGRDRKLGAGSGFLLQRSSIPEQHKATCQRRRDDKLCLVCRIDLVAHDLVRAINVKNEPGSVAEDVE